jgi:hypothetical protein
VTFDTAIRYLKMNISCPILLEAGDDIPISNYHQNRIKYADIIFTPDKRCNVKYLSQNYKSVWMPSWCDDSLFYYKGGPKPLKCITTCGDRPYVDALQQKFNDRFVNKRVWFSENTDFYNSGCISYQYARYDELTRRLFEAGGCKNAMLTNRISADTGIYDLFPENTCMAYYSSEQECLEKMSRLFNDEEYRTTLSENLYKTIVEKHLVRHRVSSILQEYHKI